MKNNNPFMWRKVLVLSATFLFTLFVGVSCKKKVNNIGQTTIDQSQILGSDGIDTFSIYTHTVQDDMDSLITDGGVYNILGSYHDPVFGEMNAEIYTQARLKAFGPNFGDISTISIDSVVLGLQYAGYYGETGIQNVRVFAINDPDGLHIDSTYYASSTLDDSGPFGQAVNLVPVGKRNLDFNPSNLTVVGSDTLDPQVRIYLDTNFGWSIINEANLNPTTFDSHEAFNDFFKGFHITTDNGFQAPGEGGVFYFDLNDTYSKMTIYYQQDGVSRVYDLVINSESTKFTHVDIDHSMTDIEAVVNDTTLGQDEYYAQSFGSRARIQIPGLDNIPENAIIHKATLEVPVSYQTGSQYAPSNDITVTTVLPTGGYGFYNFVGYDNYKKSYTIDLRAYAQAVVNNQVDNTGLALSPVLYITSGDRIIFNGPNSTNKAQPKLNIIYTEF